MTRSLKEIIGKSLVITALGLTLFGVDRYIGKIDKNIDRYDFAIASGSAALYLTGRRLSRNERSRYVSDLDFV